MDRKEEEARKAVVRRLRLILDTVGMSQTELARRLGQAQSGVSDWFTKYALPNGETLVRMFGLSAFRPISADWLLTGSGSMLRGEAVGPQRAYELSGAAALTQAIEEVEALRAGLLAGHGRSQAGASAATHGDSASRRGAGALERAAARETGRQGKRRRRPA